MKAIINRKINLKNRIVENCALLFSNVIDGIVSIENLPPESENVFYWHKKTTMLY